MEKEKKKLRIVIDPIGGLQPGDDGYPEPPFQETMVIRSHRFRTTETTKTGK